MKAKENLKQFRGKNVKDLSEEMKKQYKKLYEYRFDATFRKNKNIKAIKNIRKNIARIWSVLGEKIEKENKDS